MNRRVRNLIRAGVVLAAALLSTACFMGGLQVPLGSVTVTQTGIDRVYVTWDAGADATSYNYEIHASTTSGESASAFTPLVTVSGATSATVSGLNPGSTFHVSVRATEGGSVSDSTEETSISLTWTWSLIDAPGGTVYYGSPSFNSHLGLVAVSATEAYVAFDDSSSTSVAAVSTTEPEAMSYVDKDDLDTDIGGLAYFRGMARSGSQVLIGGQQTSSTVRAAYAATPGTAPDWTNVGTYSSSDPEIIVDDSDDGAYVLEIDTVAGAGVNYVFNVYSYNGSVFSQLGGAAAANLGAPFQTGSSAAAVELDGTTYAVVDDLGVYAYDGSSWTEVTGNLPATLFLGDLVVHDGTLYLVGYDDGTFLMHLYEYNGNDSSPSWSDAVGGPIGYDTTNGALQAGNQIAATVVSDSILIAFAEDVTYNTVRVAQVDLSGASPVVTIVDGNLAQGLNYSSTYNAKALDIGFAEGTLFVSWIEDIGAAPVYGVYTAYAR